METEAAMAVARAAVGRVGKREAVKVEAVLVTEKAAETVAVEKAAGEKEAERMAEMPVAVRAAVRAGERGVAAKAAEKGVEGAEMVMVSEGLVWPTVKVTLVGEKVRSPQPELVGVMVTA